ncbi:MAG: type VI secretion system ImpA family N-terminal domain-containing protein [Colwellia sp.]
MNYNKLLQAIDDESIVGCYLKADRSAYRSLRNTFNAAQSSFRRLTETPESSVDEALFDENQQNWLTVNQACWQTLTDKSKDIEIYCWWVMSLAFQEQAMVKIATALQVLVEFIDTFWPDVHPYFPDEKLSSTDVDEKKKQRAELQLRPLIQLLGESSNSGLLFMPLQMMKLVADIDYAKYFSASKTNNLALLKSQAQHKFPSEEAEVTQTIQAINLAISSLEKLDFWLKKTIKSLAIPIISTKFLKENLTDNLQAIKHLIADCYVTWPLNAQPEIPVNSVATEVSQAGNETITQQSQQNILAEQGLAKSSNTHSMISLTASHATRQLNNRDHAFQELRQIANYFAKQEPHSPISFLLEKAIRWGYMSLPELMLELVEGNDKVLKQINLVAGLSDEKAEIPLPKTSNKIITEQVVIPKDIKEKSVKNPELITKTSPEIATPIDSVQSKHESEFSW